jgi:hypothetical protein
VINLGQKATAAAAELRNNEHFVAFVEGLGELAQKHVMDALRVPADLRVHATSFASGLHDVWNAVEAARQGIKPNQMKPQTPKLSQGDK